MGQNRETITSRLGRDFQTEKEKTLRTQKMARNRNELNCAGTSCGEEPGEI